MFEYKEGDKVYCKKEIIKNNVRLNVDYTYTISNIIDIGNDTCLIFVFGEHVLNTIFYPEVGNEDSIPFYYGKEINSFLSFKEYFYSNVELRKKKLEKIENL